MFVTGTSRFSVAEDEFYKHWSQGMKYYCSSTFALWGFACLWLLCRHQIKQKHHFFLLPLLCCNNILFLSNSITLDTAEDPEAPRPLVQNLSLKETPTEGCIYTYINPLPVKQYHLNLQKQSCPIVY